MTTNESRNQSVMELTRRKHTLDDDMEDDDYPCKCIKEWDSWEDFKELMQSWIPKINRRWKDEDPSDLNVEVWPEIWDLRLL